jgi:hypothetical protein
MQLSIINEASIFLGTLIEKTHGRTFLKELLLSAKAYSPPLSLEASVHH